MTDFSIHLGLKPFVKSIAENVIKNGLSEGVVLNVNFPEDSRSLKGIKICRQAKGNWVEAFDKRQNPHGQDYYWLSGSFVNLDSGNETDIWALENGYASVVPTMFDLTDRNAINALKTWNLDG